MHADCALHHQVTYPQHHAPHAPLSPSRQTHDMPTTALVGASTVARMAGVTAGPAGFGLAAASAAMHAGLPPPSTLSVAMNGDAVTSLPAPDTTPMELVVTASTTPVTCTLTVRDAWGNARPGSTSHLAGELVRDGDGETTAVNVTRASPQQATERHAAVFHLSFVPRRAGSHTLQCHDTEGVLSARCRVMVRDGLPDGLPNLASLMAALIWPP